MPDGHRPAMPQVTAVDGQFGTHTRQATLTRQTRNPFNHSPGKINQKEFGARISTIVRR
jgi:hypothetical protein